RHPRLLERFRRAQAGGAHRAEPSQPQGGEQRGQAERDRPEGRRRQGPSRWQPARGKPRAAVVERHQAREIKGRGPLQPARAWAAAAFWPASMARMLSGTSLRLDSGKKVSRTDSILPSLTAPVAAESAPIMTMFAVFASPISSASSTQGTSSTRRSERAGRDFTRLELMRRSAPLRAISSQRGREPSFMTTQESGEVTRGLAISELETTT